ncbi:MAG: CvpA family protein [Gammaproteobacteria bacterium]|nr:CvpA family protein [Gammaproteobacteria bacterium]
MGWPDYAILAVIAISVLVGALRGFIKEVFSLLVWAAAFLVAYHFAGDVAAWMEDAVTLPSARTAMGFTGLFVTVLLLGGLLNYLLGRLVETTGLSGTDRLLGGVFGAARGLVLVVAVLLVAGFTPIPADPWWKDSQTIQRMLPLVEWTTGFLPESVSEHLEFEPEEPDDKDSTEPEDKEADNNQATADAGRGTISRDGADAG